jgi:uncharacterized protein YecE (DUF72 family)
MPGKIHIGTSGWSYKHWMGTFYPEGTKQKDRFAYFQKYFNTVELNSPFYHLPPRQTFEKWRDDVPADFVYAVKASRFITHMKKLGDTADALALLLDNAAGLGETLSIILFQLPPGWKVNIARLEEFLKKLPKGNRYTFEFRNPTWYTNEVYDLLRQYNCAFCIYELAGHLSPIEVTANYVYIRLHGPGDKYQGSYSDADLQQWAAKCIDWAAGDKDVYVYFDNDQEGYAAFNAIRLKEIISEKRA